MEGAAGIFDSTEVCFDLLHLPSGFASSGKRLSGCPWWFPDALFCSVSSFSRLVCTITCGIIWIVLSLCSGVWSREHLTVGPSMAWTHPNFWSRVLYVFAKRVIPVHGQFLSLIYRFLGCFLNRVKSTHHIYSFSHAHGGRIIHGSPSIANTVQFKSAEILFINDHRCSTMSSTKIQPCKFVLDLGSTHICKAFQVGLTLNTALTSYYHY